MTAPEALQQAAGYIHASLRSLSWQVELHPFTYDGAEYQNIIATRPGVRHPDKRVLVVAHYDTVENSPGADDNASSVAVVLELARVLQAVELERTVQLVAVNLEERQQEGSLDEAALFGSRALAADAEKQGWEIEGVVVLDTIAYAGKEVVQATPDGLPIKLPEVGDFIGVIGNEASSGLVTAFMQAVGRYRIPLPVLPLVVPGNGEMLQRHEAIRPRSLLGQGVPGNNADRHGELSQPSLPQADRHPGHDQHPVHGRGVPCSCRDGAGPGRVRAHTLSGSEGPHLAENRFFASLRMTFGRTWPYSEALWHLTDPDSCPTMCSLGDGDVIQASSTPGASRHGSQAVKKGDRDENCRP